MRVSFGKFVPVDVRINGSDKYASNDDRDNVVGQLCKILKNTPDNKDSGDRKDLVKQQQTAFRLGVGQREYVVPSRKYNPKSPSRSNVEPFTLGNRKYLITGDSIDARDRQGRIYNCESGKMSDVVQLGITDEFTREEERRHVAGQEWLDKMKEAVKVQHLGKTLVVEADKKYDHKMKPVYTIKHLDFYS